MPISILGNGSITGITSGGLPDGIVTNNDLATGISSSKLTGALPILDGSALTGVGVDGIVSNANATAITIDSSENVGIGISNPSANLHVKGGADTGIRIESANDGYSNLQLGDADDVVRGAISYNNADDSLQFRGYNNTERLRIDSSGNMGLGVTPESSWNASVKAFQFSNSGALRGWSNNQVDLSENAYYDTGHKYINTDLASMYAQYNGTHNFNVAASGSADAAISWTTAMTIGNTGIITMPHTAAVLNINNGESGEQAYLTIGNSYDYYRNIFLENTHSGFGSGVTAQSTLNYWNVHRSASDLYSYLNCFSGDMSDQELRLGGNGYGYADGTWNTGGADYAEFFEWSDGNPDNEDRRGISVVLESEKIRPAVEGEDPFGVISCSPAVVGDAAWNKWNKKYLRDDYGAYVFEDYTTTEWEAEEVDELETEDTPATYKTVQHSYESDKIPADITVPDDATVSAVDRQGTQFERRKLNPEWNESLDYISREDRPEWDTVGLMGKIRIRVGQQTGSRWIKMRDVSVNVQEWLVR